MEFDFIGSWSLPFDLLFINQKFICSFMKVKLEQGKCPILTESSLSAETLGAELFIECRVNTLIRLGGYPGWSVFAGRACHFVGFVVRRLILFSLLLLIGCVSISTKCRIGLAQIRYDENLGLLVVISRAIRPISSWKQLRVELTPENPHLYSKKGVWGGKEKNNH